MEGKCPECGEPLEALGDDAIVCSDCAYIQGADDESKATPKNKAPDKSRAPRVKGKNKTNKPASKKGSKTEKGAGPVDTGKNNPSPSLKSKEGGGEKENRVKSPSVKELHEKIKPDVVSRAIFNRPVVAIFAWFVGPTRGYRYGITFPKYAKPVWKKNMPGPEAYQFLTKIRRRNRFRKLESKVLLTVPGD